MRSALAAYVAVQGNNIRHNVFIGQDNWFHFQSTRKMLADPGQWFRMDFTDRPLLYWIGAACLRLTNAGDSFWLPASIFVLLSAAALWLLHDGTRSFIRSPCLRVGALIAVAFLPVTIITCVVYAADTVAMLPFVLVGWSLIRSFESKTPRAAAAYALAAGGALCLGNTAKFTFIGLPFAVLFIIAALWRMGRLTRGRAAVAALLAAIIPLGFSAGVHEMNRAQTAGMSQTAFTWPATGEITWRELLTPKGSDRRIFSAPIYWQYRMIDGRKELPLLEHHGFSYPALLHLAVYTDVMNFALHGYDPNNVARPERQQAFARAAVVLGLPFSVTAAGAVLCLWASLAWTLVRAGAGPPAGFLVWVSLATAWYLPLVLTLPFVVGAYDFGYWLPRLVLPAIWGFGLVLFGALDRVARGRLGWFAAAVLCVAVVQAFIHVGSVWY